MLNSGRTELESIDRLETKVNELLESFRLLQSENKEYKDRLISGNSSNVILDNFKRKQLRNKIEELLKNLEDF